MVAPIVPETQNLAAPFLSAYFKTLEAGRKGAEIDNKIREAQLASAIKQQQLQYQGQELDYKRDRLQQTKEIVDLKTDDQHSQQDALFGLTRELTKISDKKGTPEYEPLYNDIISRDEFKPAFRGQAGANLLRNELGNHQNTQKNQQSVFDKEIVGHGLYAPNGKPDYDPLIHPEVWQEAKDASGKPTGDVFVGIRDRNGTYQLGSEPVIENGVAKQAPVMGRYVTMKKEQRDSLISRMQQTYPQFTGGNIGAQPISESVQQEAALAREVLANPKANKDAIRAEFKKRNGVDLDQVQ